jgi:hypothetical protein
MLEKFDPAPIDKNAVDPQEASGVDWERHAKLEAGLIDVPRVGPGKRHTAGTIQTRRRSVQRIALGQAQGDQ